jgi:undecaprenyl diphosphate synthase
MDQKAAEQIPESGLEPGVPRHIAIIMDGNGRWAAKRNLPRIAGHKRGAEAVRNAVEGSIEAGVRYLTLYAFSSENWNRPADEVSSLMGLLRLYIQSEIKALHKNGVRIRFIGERDGLESDIVGLIEQAENKTLANQVLDLVIAINYGGRSEIVRAVKMLADEVKAGHLSTDAISEEMVSNHLFLNDIPDPDLIIRTSGEERLSNFLLWQVAYSEFLFLDVLWPDFNKASLRSAIHTYGKRERRFGARS